MVEGFFPSFVPHLPTLYPHPSTPYEHYPYDAHLAFTFITLFPKILWCEYN